MKVLTRGVDYSFDRPDPACLHRHGYRFAVRYLSAGSSAKNLTSHEMAALTEAGLSVVLVYQDGTSDMLAGEGEGRRDGKAAADAARRLGWPDSRPIFFALDRDPNPLSPTQIAACRAYLGGVARIIGRRRVGLYAGWRAIELLCPGWAPWGWQTYAWSSRRISTKAHFRQYLNNVARCGGAVDLNETYRDDFGQWPIETPTTPPALDPGGDNDMTPDQARKLDDLHDWLSFAVGQGQKDPGGTIRSIHSHGVETVRNSRKIQTGDQMWLHVVNAVGFVLDRHADGGKISDEDLDQFREFVADAAREQVAESLPAALADLSPEAIAEAIVEAFPQDLAQEVVDEAASRLGT